MKFKVTVDTDKFEKDFKKEINRIVENHIADLVVEHKCPHCDNLISVSSGLNVCPICDKQIDVNFNVNYDSI